ncbi:MAG: S41 family peptidase, partial [Acidobacteriota bacterium]
AALLILLAAAPSQADDRARWMRYPAISPDGQWIAFAYRGDLWRVAAGGGDAVPLTGHVDWEGVPVWSPDSRHIAFASDRHGNLDVFVVGVSGGDPRRLTYHSSDDTPTSFSPDGSRILFSSLRLDAPGALLGDTRMPELYSVAADGGRPRQELTTPAEAVRYAPDGRRAAYQDLKGYEDPWRKHHTSAVTRDLWLWEPASGRHIQLTDRPGEDRDPVWSPAGDALFYLSEADGTSNVWRLPLEGDRPGTPEQVTQHGPHPVRFLSIAGDGTLAYGYHGRIYTLSPGGSPSPVDINVYAGPRVDDVDLQRLRDGATEMALSPHGDEVAFVIRGEIFAASVDHGTTRRLTSTPEQERSLSFAPDGRSLYFAGERDGSWNLYRLSLARDEEDRFFEATALDEEVILANGEETFQPAVSPDGTRLAYLENRDTLTVLDLASGTSTPLIPADRNYSYADGDIDFRWSPDARHLAATYYGSKRWIQEIALVDTETGNIVNASVSGYAERAPRWSFDGRALLFLSDREGRRSHGSWGSDDDIYALHLDRDSFDRSRLPLEDYERWQDRQKEAKGDKGKKDGGKTEVPRKPADPVTVERKGLEDRLRRLTLHSAPMADYVPSNDGETLFFLAQVEDAWDLWISKPRQREARRLVALGDRRPGQLALSLDGETLVVRRGDGRLMSLDVAGIVKRKKNGNGNGNGGGAKKPEAIPYRAEMTVDRRGERRYLFEHAWRQVREKFYTADLHGVDWPFLKAEYEPFLDDLANGRDFAELLSEILGELNASHTGARYRHRDPEGDVTAALGLVYDTTHDGSGLKIAEVLPRGPVDLASSRVEAGDLLTHIDGEAILADASPWPLLNRKVDQRVRLTFESGTGEPWEEVVRPIRIRAEQALLYERWIERMNVKTAELSDGRVGFVHVPSMNDRSFRRFYREVLGRHSDKEALVLDTRWNGGGWLHDDLVAFLQGQGYATFAPRGKEPGSFGGEPLGRWARPSAVLMNEDNYSDGHIFPYAFKAVGLGPLVGTPVAGTGTAVWWEQQIDGATVFGIPQVGMLTPEGDYLENLELQPDHLVYNHPEKVAAGEDQQLEKAVALLLETLDAGGN